MYIVWHDFGSEGWLPSAADLQSLDDVWEYLQTNPHRSQAFVITERVDVRLIDMNKQ